MMKNNDARFAAITCVPANGAGVNPAGDWIILCDFDGTISCRDVTDFLLDRFGLPGYEALEQEWEEGRIGSRQCLQGQIALLQMRAADLDASLEQIDIDPDFAAFVAQAEAEGVPLHVVSDGLDYAIHHILGRHGLAHLPVLANHLVATGPDSWRLEFSHAAASCLQASGNCKCACTDRVRRPGRRVLFIGDGTSDFCAAGVADVVLAKDKLIQHCETRGIPHFPIRSFAEARALLPHILLTERDAVRATA